MKISNINTLRKILISKLDGESQGKLVQLYKDNLNFWTKLSYGATEILDDMDIVPAKVILTEEESKVYNQVKNEENLLPETLPIIKKIIDKFFSST